MPMKLNLGLTISPDDYPEGFCTSRESLLLCRQASVRATGNFDSPTLQASPTISESIFRISNTVHPIILKNNPTFSRKSQLFYILWLIFYNNITVDNIKKNRTELLSDIQTMYSKLENVEEISVNQQYVDDFIFKLREIQTKYA